MLEDEEFVSVDNFLPFIIIIIVSLFIMYFIYRYYSVSKMEKYASDLYNQIMEIRGKLWLWMNMEGGAIKIVK